MPKILISYYPEDSEHVTRQIFKRLAIHFGRVSLFMDGPESGTHSTPDSTYVSEEVRRCDVILAVIGEDGLQRLREYRADPVRIAIEIGLERRIPVIPVLVGEARLAAEQELPNGVKELAHCNSAQTLRDEHVHADIDRLIRAIENSLGLPALPIKKSYEFFSPTAFLFGQRTIVAATQGTSPFGHTFGGPHDRTGTAREDCRGILIHLLHRFDLSDPTIPIAIPGRRWLPLYYCFDYRANDVGYQLRSDDSLVTFFPSHDRNVTSEETWPYEDYPREFPRSSIQVAAWEYEPTNYQDVYAWRGIFGRGNLSDTDHAAAEQFAEEMGWEGAEPFIQGEVDDPCLNPMCPNHKIRGRLSTIAVIPAEPITGLELWGYGGNCTQLIYQLCNECHTIRVSNQC
jgi:hypothetical protein